MHLPLPREWKELYVAWNPSPNPNLNLNPNPNPNPNPNLVHRPIGGLGGGRGGGGCWALAEPPKDTLGLRLAKGVEDVERACVCVRAKVRGRGEHASCLLSLAACRGREPGVHAGRELLQPLTIAARRRRRGAARCNCTARRCASNTRRLGLGLGLWLWLGLGLGLWLWLGLELGLGLPRGQRAVWCRHRLRCAAAVAGARPQAAAAGCRGGAASCGPARRPLD